MLFVTVGIADPANLPEDVGLPKNAVRGREYVEKRALEPGDRPEPYEDPLGDAALPLALLACAYVLARAFLKRRA